MKASAAASANQASHKSCKSSLATGVPRLRLVIMVVMASASAAMVAVMVAEAAVMAQVEIAHLQCAFAVHPGPGGRRKYAQLAAGEKDPEQEDVREVEGRVSH